MLGLLKRRSTAAGAEAEPEPVGRRLLDDGALTRESLEQAHSVARQSGRPLARTLVDMGVISEEQLYDAYAALTGLPVWSGRGRVLTEEPPRNGNVLLDADIPNLLVTPHSAWGSRTARQRIVEQTLENIHAWQANDPIRVVV